MILANILKRHYMHADMYIVIWLHSKANESRVFSKSVVTLDATFLLRASGSASGIAL